MHGEITFGWEGNVIEIYAKGPFNEEGLAHSISLVKQSVLDKKLHSWARLEHWDNETLGSPECTALSKAAAAWFIEHGCYASAIVVSNSLQRTLIEKEAVHQTIGIFSNIDDAKAWLAAQAK